jgi:predicted Zn-dependent protease
VHDSAVTEPESRVQKVLIWAARHLVIIAVVSLITFGVQSLLPQGRPRSPIPVPSPPPGRSLYLAPIGDFPIADAETLVAHFQEKFGISVGLLPSMPVPDDSFDPNRNQLIAERLIDAIGVSYDVAADPGAVVIGLTDVDMYIAARTWQYAYSLRADDRFAVVSSARMDAFAANDAKQMERLRKMVTKNIGVLFYGLPQSDDRGSVLYRDILGPLDLDRASEDF